MYLSSIVLCYILLFVASFSYSLGNSTNNDEQRNNLTVHDFFAKSMKDREDKMQLILYNLHEDSIKNDKEMQYESRINSNGKNLTRYKYHGHIMKIHKENNQNNQSMESSVNSTLNNVNDSTLQVLDENLMKTDRENNSILYELYKNFNRDNNSTMSNSTIISYDACNGTCIQFCCPFGDRLTSEKKCVAGQDNYFFPNVYQNNSENRKLDELFKLTVHDPCVLQGSGHRVLSSNEYSFLVNGSLYLAPGELISSTSYCLGVLDRDIYDVIVCMNQIGFPTYISVCLLVSLPFLLLTFVVYSILPEVQNVHSYTLRVHVASLFTTNVIIFCVQEIPQLYEWKYCIPLAYIFNFSMLSGCFWLNATCFDIWWTFRKLDLHQPNGKERKKKFMMYSIYAWGMTISLNIACAIMDHVSGIPKELIRPEMCTKKFWFGRDDALTVYYYGPTGVAFISNICFFLATALTILYHNKHTARQLRDSQNRRYDKKKHKFNMYLKLFIVMGISWSMGIILWLINASNSIPQMVWNISYTIDILQGVIIFIIYVCKKKILRLLLKRFGWHDRDLFCNISITTRTSSNMSNVSSITSGSIAMKKINSSINQQTNFSFSNPM